MQKNCKKCLENFEITNSDLEFYKKVSPKFGEKVFEIPVPILCPECRQQRRISFRNFYKLYKSKCSATWENMISMYSPDKNFTVYHQDFWWSDKWNAFDYGINFNFSKSFFTQFEEFFKKVPKINLINFESENIEYSNFSKASKNCYLVSGNISNEDCMYGHIVWKSKDIVDGLYVYESENCYECTDCVKWYNLRNCRNSSNCKNSEKLIDCENCEFCFWCVWLKNKNYYIFNEKIWKEKYETFLEKAKKIENIEEKINNLSKNHIVKNINWTNNQNVTWDYIYNSKNITTGFDLKNCEDSKFLYTTESFVTCYDCSYSPAKTELSYESIFLHWYNILFSHNILNGTKIYYSFDCYNSENLFACSWLKNASYCIFNKKYTKEKYNKLVPKIIEKMQKTWEWWEFFPANLSPFWYNETVAGEYFPLNKEEIINQNFNYSEYEAPFTKVEKIISASKLPENISDIPDDILNWAIECEISKKPFRIIKQELEFYRKHNLPIPKKHPDIRHSERMKLRNPRKLFDRKCDKCWVEMKSTYKEDRKEIVYCEKCYNKETY